MLVVHTESSLGWGGQEIRVLTESRELIQRGHKVILLADEESLIARRAVQYAVPVYRLRLKKKRIVEVAAMIRALRELKPDVVSCHSSTDHWVVAIARLFLRDKPPVVRTRHISASVNKNWATYWLYRAGCAAVVTTGESIRVHLIHRKLVHENKVLSIPTGIDLGFFKNGDRQRARLKISNELSIDPNALLFGNVATLRSWKGHSDLIKAFAAISAELPTSRLVIVGDGPQAGRLEALVESLNIAGRVCFVGYQSDVRDYFDSIDIFVFPSYANEGVPQAILQAMAYGLPIITTAVGSIREALDDYPAATIVTARDITQIADAMRNFKLLTSFRVKLSLAARRRIDIRMMTERMEAVYRTIVSKA